MSAQWLTGFSEGGFGIAQGSPISPLLANLYLHPLDRLLVAAGHRAGALCDDFVCCRPPARACEQAWRIAEGVLAERGLALKAAKTRIVAPGTPFRFLGEMISAPPYNRAGLLR